MLRGRRGECAELDTLLKRVRGGESRALVLHGEHGVGKTALLEYLAERAPGMRTVRITGVPSETELAFAGLHRLCTPLSDGLAALPAPQREALHAALGLSSGRAPDRFLVGLAALGLLAEAARERPILCLVDDVQWLDQASVQALAFAARRLRAESVALVFAAREPGDELAGLPEMAVTGLSDEDARELVRTSMPGTMDERVLERFVAETRGNPLALLELPKEATLKYLAGGYGVPDIGALASRLQVSYQRRVEELPERTRRLLLVAAAEPGGRPVLLWQAADRLGIGIGAASPAVEARLVEIDDRVRFRHPLVRSAVYWSASPEDRRATHRVLAEVTDPEHEPERRVWHAAQGAEAPDEEIAAELERSAGRARARGGLAAAAAFLARAVELTPDHVRRQQRALAAARATHQAGSPDTALRLLSVAEAAPLDQGRRAQVELLRAQIAFTTDRGREAPRMLLDAARRLAPQDPALARETYLEAVSAALFAGRPDGGAAGEVEAEAARSAPPPPEPPRPADLLLDGMVLRITEGLAAGVPALEAAMRIFRGPGLPEEDGLRWLWPAGVMAAALWDLETWDVLAARHVRLARECGQTTALPLALTQRVAVEVFAGDLANAEGLVEEVATLSEAIGSPAPPYGALLVTAWRGRGAEGAALSGTVAAEAARRGEGNGLTVGAWAAALLANGLGHHEEALAAVPEAGEDRPADVGSAPWALVEYIEAAALSGAPERAAAALRRLAEVTVPAGTDWALGVHARSQALLSSGSAAEDRHREAIELLGRTGVRGELARAHLLYGEWLRRERRRRDAREELRTAHESFTVMGMEAFAKRAARELVATGESVRRRPGEAASELTPQEAQIVRLVREGLTNPEIGARLFISPRTVEWHLRKTFGKLGITSRKQLQRGSAPGGLLVEGER
ncbi:AAA family ATPase [Actinomadura sp. WMMA1423]|uniref:AAA family ATPase n=1 Tax=Actinomadura sp. WMMA1423 TaxID=2591108 RepID=UPI0011478D38|nr:helix-turn-helix transcriptional regulator [Actinomadura sp. WMMA1423]